MKNEIIAHLNQPARLEKLYRTNKASFKREFDRLYPELKGNLTADLWNERLNYENEEINWGTGGELLFVMVASLLAGVVAKLPAILSINEDYFYPRNIGFIVFPALAAYFSWKNKLSTGKIAFIVGAALVGLIFINSLPDVQNSDTLILSCLHLPLFLWLILGFAFTGGTRNAHEKRLGYLNFNGDLLIMSALLLIAGGIMSGITIGLFSLIGFDIAEFYIEYVGVFGLAAIPIIATYLTQANPLLVNKISTVIAK